MAVKKRKLTPPELIKIITAAAAALIVFFLLALWTRALSKEEEAEILRSAMRSVIETEGEKGLLMMAGVPVDDISYGPDAVPLFAGERPAWTLTEEEQRAISIYSGSKDSVVQIVPASELSGAGQGAGVIISPDGYILTNRHVAGNARDFLVSLPDGSVYEAVLVGADTLSDIAVLKADAEGLPAIKTGNSSSLCIGESVYAIGHPYGYTWSMTKGIVSGLGRMVFTDSGGVLPSMIQTDAIINPGNSGGPLIASDGSMVGIVSSIYSRSGSAEGISFAIPAETAMDTAEEIIKNGKVERGWLDILSVALNPQIAEYSSLPVSEGILVSQVVPGGEADRGGLKGGSEAVQYGQSVIYLGGDVITAIDGRSVSGYDDYFAALFGTRPGDKVDITVVRKGAETLLKDVVLVAQTEDNSRWLVR